MVPRVEFELQLRVVVGNAEIAAEQLSVEAAVVRVVGEGVNEGEGTLQGRVFTECDFHTGVNVEDGVALDSILALQRARGDLRTTRGQKDIVVSAHPQGAGDEKLSSITNREERSGMCRGAKRS